MGGRLPLLGITSGDPNGIGPEVVLRAILDRRVRRACRTLLVGDAGVFEHYRKKLGLPLTLLPLDHPPPSWGPGIVPVIGPTVRTAFRVQPGVSSGAAGSIAARALLLAAELWRRGAIDGIVTGPLSKQSINDAGYRFPGQTEMLAAGAGAGPALMVMLAGPLRVALATIHMPLRRVAGAITKELLARTIAQFISSLTLDFGIRRPRVAVLGLNPHAGEGGLLGSEERDVIAPAVRRAASRKARVEGPFPADGFFGSGAWRKFDGVLAMYHDQGLIPLKMAGLASAVNVTAGLPLVRTSPGHGTAYDLAGTGAADPSSTVAAIVTAAGIVRRRRSGMAGHR